MANYCDVLLTSDHDRTLTAPDSTIPQRNLEAIQYFMEQGGAFTVNTGRTLPSYKKAMETVPSNAPFLLYNGSAAYDKTEEKFVFLHEFKMKWAETLKRIRERFPSVWVEFQGQHAHYLFREHAIWEKFCENNNIAWKYAEPNDDLGPFLKFCVYARISEPNFDHLFQGEADEIAMMDEVEAWLNEEMGDTCAITRSANLYIDVQPAGVSKGKSSVELKEQMGKKILVCIGDAENDLTMLDSADYAFCPCDGALKDKYTNVCGCAEGAVADLIYNVIPKL